MEKTINPAEVNRIARSFGLELRKHSDQIISNSYKFYPVTMSADEVVRIFKAKTGVNYVGTADRIYKIIKKSDWDAILEVPFIKVLGYTPELNDCDNHAFGFACETGRLFGINSAFVAYGEYIKGTFKNMHYWNIVLAYDKDNLLQCYTIEPQRSEIVKFGETINGATYRLNKITMGF